MCKIFRPVLAIAVMVACPVAGFALDCPVIPTVSGPGVLAQTPDQTTADGNLLANDNSGNAIDEVIYRLRQIQPRPSNEEITNYMVTAYCPVLAQAGYDDAEAVQKLDHFSQLVEDQLAPPTH